MCPRAILPCYTVIIKTVLPIYKGKATGGLPYRMTEESVSVVFSRFVNRLYGLYSILISPLVGNILQHQLKSDCLYETQKNLYISSKTKED
jgi:hypothetical protein